MKAVLTILAAGLLTACASEGTKVALIEERTVQHSNGTGKVNLPGPNHADKPVGGSIPHQAPTTVAPAHSGDAVIKDQVQTKPIPIRDVEEKPISILQTHVPITSRLDEAGMDMRLVVNDVHGNQGMCRVQFDYDSTVIAATYSTLLETCADFLKINSAVSILLQGNTDERGSRDYNLALGQKRANSVFEALRLLGVPESQMESVSIGEENPESDAHDENAWAQNRRVDVFYK